MLDCSVAINWCLPDENNGYADKTLTLLQSNISTVEAIVPGIWSLEIANTLLTSERRQRMTPTQVQIAVSAIESLSIVVDQVTAETALHDGNERYSLGSGSRRVWRISRRANLGKLVLIGSIAI